MTKPTFTKGLAAAVDEAIEKLDFQPFESTTVKIGDVVLNDGRQSEIRIFLTSNPDDFGSEPSTMLS